MDWDDYPHDYHQKPVWTLKPYAPGSRHGHPWQLRESAFVKECFLRGKTLEYVMRYTGRSTSGITSRLRLSFSQEAVQGWANSTEGDTNVIIITGTKEELMEGDNCASIYHLVTLMQEGYTTAKAKFAVGGKTYTYKVPLSMGLKAGDHAVVKVGGEFKVAEIAEVHEQPEIDVRAPYAYRWIVCKVDVEQYNETMERENKAIEALQRAERTTARERAMKKLSEILGGLNIEEARRALKGE
jgi:hypothetical protein